MSTKRNSVYSTRNLTTMAILTAISSILFLIEIPITLFYKLDFSNLPILLSTFSLGVVPGIITLLLKAFIGLLHSSSQGIGELADFLIGLSMIVPVGLIYQRKKTRFNAILGMVVGTFIAMIVGGLVNLYIMIPFYGAVFGMPVEQIVAMGQVLVPQINSDLSFVMLITLPFNLLKFTALSIITALIYKPLAPILHGNRYK